MPEAAGPFHHINWRVTAESVGIQIEVLDEDRQGSGLVPKLYFDLLSLTRIAIDIVLDGYGFDGGQFSAPSI